MNHSCGAVLIHGTDRPWGIGTRASHGCIRLYPEDMARLFALVRVGTRVTIIDEPVKVARERGKVLVEVHSYEERGDLYQLAVRALAAARVLDEADREKLKEAVQEHTGRVVDVTMTATATGNESGASPASASASQPSQIPTR